MLQKQLFDIKFTAKQLARESKKAEKRQAEHKLKLKNAIEKQDMERAKICAENALREKQQSLALLKLSSRMEAVAQRVEQALVLGKVTKVRKIIFERFSWKQINTFVEKLTRVGM